ncbi:phosphotransferase enzyme family protein [Vulcanococcus sp.]|uniref:phosphotransferase enzyme family protein n=1 Tax=Vulcanococcus sp. TaxID=2856995 RepID=UPI003C0EA085
MTDPATCSPDSQVLAVAEAFHGPGAIEAIDPLGNGNVNDTYLLRTGGASYVLQRLNTAVFSKPEQVMENLRVLGEHVQPKLQEESRQPGSRRWELPQVIGPRAGTELWHCCSEGGFWRCTSYIENACSIDRIEQSQQAKQVGAGLGRFHRLIHDIPCDQLQDTLEGFHVTPLYLEQYHQALVRTTVKPSEATDACIGFIRERESFCAVLEQAKARGELLERPIHGDPKCNNVMLDLSSGEAIALIDLDTVKPGLIHYDIGDGLRSCCNPAGEECEDLEQVVFSLDLARAMLEGYLAEAHGFITPWDLHYIPAAARLISFELGLRFFTDHLNGNVYFKADHPTHNLQRALVQFRLTESIEQQLMELEQLVAELSTARAGSPC